MNRPVSALLALSVLAFSLVASADVRVNEIMSSNKKTIANAAGVYADWVELYNSGSEAVDVSGWRLCDSTTKAWSKWHALPEGTVIPANGYLLVWADDVDGMVGGEIHVAVGFSASGEEVALARAEGDIVSSFAFPQQTSDISYGYDAGGNLVFFETPTPGAANGAASVGVTPAILFSERHGFKSTAFTLTLEPEAPTSKQIYYTLDGSSPVDSATRMAYTGPISISTTSIVRAAAPDPEATRVEVSTATYIFLAQVVAQGQTQSGVANFPDETMIAPIIDGEGNAGFKQWLWYGMEQSIVNGADSARIIQGFMDIPTLSIVTDSTNLFDRETGIYVNAQATKTVQPWEDSRKWERPANLEMIDPSGDPAKEFSVPLGLRLRGHYSRGMYFPKHSFRCFMRKEYGMSKLKFPLLGDERAEFEKFDIRSDQNHAWPSEIGNQFDQPQNWTAVNDIFARDLQRAAGRPATCGDYCHLFVNGQYWGLYQTQERLDADFLSQRIGGSEDEWSAIKSDTDGGLDAADGTTEAWEALREITLNEGFGASHPNNYNRVRGLDSNGLRDESLPVYVDVKNLADFVILSHWTADADSPVNPVICAVNNLRMGFRNGVNGDGFKFFRHDNEHNLYQTFQNFNMGDAINAQLRSKWLEGPDVNPLLWGTPRNDEGIDFGDQDRSGVGNFSNDPQSFNPFMLHYRLEENSDYKVAFADRVKRLCFGKGALTPAKAEALYRARMAQIDNAIVCESARWGWYDRPAYWGGYNHFTRDTWASACNRVLRDFIPYRTAKLVQHYRDAGWYPSFDAPEASQTEGTLNVGEKLYFTAAKQVYYTTDGSDPRASGGSISPKAHAYTTDGIAPTTPVVTVFARAYDSATGEWSAKTEVELNAEIVGELSEGDLGENLRVLEVLSCTADAEQTGNADDESIVLTNISASVALNLAGVRITSAKTGKGELSLDLTLASGALAPNSALVLTKGANWPSQYITNGDIDIRLLDGAGLVIQSCHIEDSWLGGAADGTGNAYVAVSFDRVVDTESEWTCEDAGSEGGDDPEPGDDPDPQPSTGDAVVTLNGKLTVSNYVLGSYWYDGGDHWESDPNATSVVTARARVADGHYVTAGGMSTTVSDRGVLSGYKVYSQGDFPAEFNLYPAGANPEGNAWSNNHYYRISGTIAVSAVGKVSFCIGTGGVNDSDMDVLVTISNGNRSYTIGSSDRTGSDARILKTIDFAVSGNYTLVVEQYYGSSHNGNGCIELSTASGEVTEFSTNAFTLLGAVPAAAEPNVCGISLDGGKVAVSIDNAKAGVRYGYKFAERLQDVDKAEVIWLDGAAAADGVLTLDIDRTTPSGFFRLVAE